MARTPIPSLLPSPPPSEPRVGVILQYWPWGRGKTADFEVRGRGLLAGWEAPWGAAEPSRVTGNEGPRDMPRPSWEGPLLPSPVPGVVVLGS